jgi:hypothetical protein
MSRTVDHCPLFDRATFVETDSGRVAVRAHQVVLWAGLRVQGVSSIDNTRSSIPPDVLSRPPETPRVAMDSGEPLRLRVFVDKSSDGDVG